MRGLFYTPYVSDDISDSPEHDAHMWREIDNKRICLHLH